MTVTVAALRGHVASARSDEALQMLIDAAYADVASVAGPPDDVTVTTGARGGGDLALLPYPAETITSVVEDADVTAVVLATDDWELRASGTVLRRLATGTNGSSGWRGRVVVEYVRRDDSALRDRAVVQLCQLALNYSPGATSEQIGDWSETFANNSAQNFQLERDTILQTVNPDPLGAW